MAWTEAGRKHELDKKGMDQEHEESMARMNIDFQRETDEANRKAERENRQSEERQAIAEAQANVKIAEAKASVDKKALELNAAADADAREKQHDFNMAKIEAERSMSETEEREETKRLEIAEFEKTKRAEASANRDIEVSNNERIIKEKEYSYKEVACKELSKMFENYLSAVTESHKMEIEMLIKVNENRKEKYLADLDSDKARFEKLLELSQTVTGQEKALYLNELSEVEISIRNRQQEDKEADEVLVAKLMDLKEVQKIEMASQQEKLINTNTLLLGEN